MAIGFEYNGIHSSTFGLVMKSSNRTLLPGLLKKEIQIPGKHGSYDFSDNVYENRIITIDISYIGTSINDLRLNMRNISTWLSQQIYYKLFFDDEPDKYYLAKIYSSAGLENLNKYGKSQLQFECLPMALYGITSGEDITWGDDANWGMDIAWDNILEHTIIVAGNTTFDLDYFGTYNLGSGSENGSKFDIIITGSFTTLTFALNGKTITYGTAVSSKVIIIDNINMTIKEDATNKLSLCSGDLTSFLHLISGTNTVTISGTGLNCSILFDYSPQYL